MASVHFEAISPLPCDTAGTDDDLELDIERELGRHITSTQTQPEPVQRQPLRMALSAIRTNLDRRMREWRGSAKVVEQTLRQLVAAEQARAQALTELARVQGDVAHTGHSVTQALASFDESEEIKDIDPLFDRSQTALDDLDRVTSDLSIAQIWCRSAWKQYAEALEKEQLLRFHIQSSDWHS